MGKVIKLTEEELHRIIREKIQEALEHNVDLDYSPAIGNKKRGPGKETMDQMKKRKNTKLDEEVDERDIYRRLPDGDLDYDGDDGVGDSSSGKYTVTLDADSYAYAFKEVYGRVPENLSDILEENDFPEEVDVAVSLKVNHDPGDRDTPPSHDVDIENWEIEDNYIMSSFNGEFMDVIAKAVDYEMEKTYPDDVYDSINESKTKKDMGQNIVKLNEGELMQLISESVKKVIDEAMEEGAIGNFFNRTFNGKNVQARANQLRQLFTKYQNAFLKAKSNMNANVQKLYNEDLARLKNYYQRAAKGENIPDKNIQGVTRFLDKYLGRANKSASMASDAELRRNWEGSRQSKYEGGGNLPYNSGGMGPAYQKYGIPDDVLYGQRG